MPATKPTKKFINTRAAADETNSPSHNRTAVRRGGLFDGSVARRPLEDSESDDVRLAFIGIPPRKRMSPKSAGSVTIVVERDIADDSRRINIACGASKPVEAVNVNRCPLDPAAVRSAAGEARRTTRALRSDVRGPAIEGPDPGSRSIPTVPQCRTTRRPTWCRRGASVGLTLVACDRQQT